MAAYATVRDIETRLGRTFDTTETATCNSLLDEAAVLIDSYNSDADSDAKKTVSIRIVSRAIGAEDAGVPVGASQGSMSALGYSQSWTLGTGGSVGELYLGRAEKHLLGVGECIGTYSPIEALCPPEVTQ